MKDESNTRKIIEIWMKACFERLMGADEQPKVVTSPVSKHRNGEASDKTN
jgi:hypothetical protein